MRIGSDLGTRVTRILALTAALSLVVLPAMMLHHGIDGWLWPLTAAVVVCVPIGVVGVDYLAELLDRSGWSLRVETRTLRWVLVTSSFAALRPSRGGRST
jgi:hypothetical protein